MYKGIKNWHLSVLVGIISIISVALIQQYASAQWNDPIGLPGETSGFRLVVNPMTEDLLLNGHDLVDSNLLIDGDGLQVIQVFNGGEICFEDDCIGSWDEDNGVFNPMREDLDLNNFVIRDNTNLDFILEPGGYGLEIIGDQRGVYGSSGSFSGVGVYGQATSGEGDGVWGVGSPHAGGTGIYGEGYSGLKGSGLQYGVKGVVADNSTLGDSAGIQGERNVGDYAGYFVGRVTIDGSNTPSYEHILELFDNTDVILRLDSNAKTNTAQVEFVRGDVVNTDYSWIGPTDNDTFDFWTTENIPMTFGINNTEVLNISTTGNLSTTGTIQSGSYSTMPICNNANYGALGWQLDCGTGAGCLEVCTETGWLQVATN
ncbi:MAG: hypothetical protein HOC78_03855 [Candidatus Komeilibacteria bacterium]|jgi:hypothetical protein|nr:hypothetical protein [Candidatus Komeilibacteria bacterium]